MTQETARKKLVQQVAPLDPDAPFTERLRERLTYLRQRRWVQLSLIAFFLAFAVWGFFYVRSLLPRTPAQRLENDTRSAQTYLHLQEAQAKLTLIRAMIGAGRESANIERYRSLLASDLEATFERSPKALRANWPELKARLNHVQRALNEDNEEALVALNELEVVLQRLTSTAQ